jgi:hypothetical protein
MLREKPAILKDKYDHAIEYLIENPETITEAWSDPGSYEGRGGELFGFVGPDWESNSNKIRYRGEFKGSCGCLQQIREAYESECDIFEGEREWDMFELSDNNLTLSFWPELWQKIASDERLPSDHSDISVRDLQYFAEWQREVDAYRTRDGIEVAPSVYQSG